MLGNIINNNGEVTARAVPRNKTMFRAMGQTIKANKTERFISFFGAAHTHYQQASSLAHKAGGLPGITGKDVLNLVEAIYDVPALKQRKDEDVLSILNTGCKVTLLRAAKVPGYEAWADFIFVSGRN